MFALPTAALILMTVVAVALALRLRVLRRRADRLRERLDALERESRRVDEAKERFLASITHELRTPLTAILGYQELLADGMYGEMSERFGRPLARIGNAADHLLQLVDGVLELARLDSGRLELDLARVRPEEPIRRAAQHVARLAEEAGGSLETDVPEHLPTITTDPARLERALRLALLAAVRASPGTALRIVARPDDDSVRVEIRGTRLALDAHSPERVFGDFDRVPDGEEPLGRTGLRLSIALRLARRLGGDLDVRATEEHTTTVTVRIVDAPLLVKASSGNA